MNTEVGQLIEQDAAIAGGQPCLAGTGMPVSQMAVHYKAGESPSQILQRFPHLDLARIHAAIAYYLANHERIDAELQADEREFQAARKAQKLAQRSA